MDIIKINDNYLKLNSSDIVCELKKDFSFYKKLSATDLANVIMDQEFANENLFDTLYMYMFSLKPKEKPYADYDSFEQILSNPEYRVCRDYIISNIKEVSNVIQTLATYSFSYSLTDNNKKNVRSFAPKNKIAYLFETLDADTIKRMIENDYRVLLYIDVPEFREIAYKLTEEESLELNKIYDNCSPRMQNHIFRLGATIKYGNVHFVKDDQNLRSKNLKYFGKEELNEKDIYNISILSFMRPNAGFSKSRRDCLVSLINKKRFDSSMLHYIYDKPDVEEIKLLFSEEHEKVKLKELEQFFVSFLNSSYGMYEFVSINGKDYADVVKELEELKAINKQLYNDVFIEMNIRLKEEIRKCDEIIKHINTDHMNLLEYEASTNISTKNLVSLCMRNRFNITGGRTAVKMITISNSFDSNCCDVNSFFDRFKRCDIMVNGTILPLPVSKEDIYNVVNALKYYEYNNISLLVVKQAMRMYLLNEKDITCLEKENVLRSFNNEKVIQKRLIKKVQN